MSRFKKADNVDSLAGFRSDKAEATVASGLLKAARKSGHLNLSGRALTQVPQSVYRINCEPAEDAQHSLFCGDSDRWWEQTDLTKLYLSSNQLTHLSEDIRLLPALTVLDLDDNQLSCLPEALEELQELQQLRLSHNQLASVPACLFRLKSLASLALHFNLLESLPEDLGRLHSLVELDLSNNHLRELPASLGCLTSLQKLSLSHNQLRCLPESLGQLTKVKTLDCSSNQLTDVPAGLSHMSALEQLYLRHNKLRLLPHLTSAVLQDLYVGNNQIERLEPERLSSLTAISVLELRDNKIKVVPEQMTLLSTLTRLDLANNDISSLPASLGLLAHLKVLLLEGNPLRGIRRDLLSKGTTELLKYLRGRITEAPPTEADEEPTAMTLPSQAKVNVQKVQTLKMLQFRGLQPSSTCSTPLGLSSTCSTPLGLSSTCSTRLGLSSTCSTLCPVCSEQQASVVPDELFDGVVNQVVTAVDFSHNLLTSVPSRLVELSSWLSDVNLAFNRLSSCEPVCGLAQLTHLDLRNNQMTELPAEMKNLGKLRSIILNHNRFRSFPEVLYHILSLETILLGNNQVDGVDPSGLMKLSRLSTLDLSNNDVLKVPPELGLCTSLRCLSLEGNPFRVPRAAVVARGTDAVMEYLRSRIPA